MNDMELNKPETSKDLINYTDTTYGHNEYGNEGNIVRYYLPCDGRTVRTAKDAASNGRYMHMIESYKTRKSSPYYSASLVFAFMPKRMTFRIAFSIGAYDHAKEMAIYAAYLMEKVAYGDNFPKSEYDRKLEQISKLTVDEMEMVNYIAADKLEAIYNIVNNYMRKHELKKNQLVSAMAEQYERIKSEIDKLAYGSHNRIEFNAKNTHSSRKNLHVGNANSLEVGDAWFAEMTVQRKDVSVTTRIKFLSRTYGERTRPLAVYAAYLMEKTVYGTSMPKGEYEAKMLEILKLTTDDRFMVEQRVLTKLRLLLDAVNKVCENMPQS